MKLAMFCVAALSLTAAGCLDETANPGGHTAGMRPAKPSVDNPTDSPTPATPEVYPGMNLHSAIEMPDLDADNVSVDFIKPPVPMEGVCGDCDVIAITLKEEGSALEEIRVFTDGGMPLCRIYLSDNEVVIDECGWGRN